MLKKGQKSLSFHPRLAAFGDLLFSCIMMWWFVNLSHWWVVGVWFIVRLVWWISLARFVYYSKGLRRHLHIFSLLIFYSGATSWLLFIDRDSWVWDGVMLLNIFLPAISFSLLPTTQNDLSFVGKPQRRFRLALSVLGIAGLWSGVGALIAYNIFSVPIFVWIVAVAFITSSVSVVWWKEYGVQDRNSLVMWMVGIFLLVLEFAWIIELWPIHYLSSGLCITWLWYTVWLLARFHLSSEGIQWKKHFIFLSTNAILFLLFILTLVRWK
jgi:hypothetical protein